MSPFMFFPFAPSFNAGVQLNPFAASNAFSTNPLAALYGIGGIGGAGLGSMFSNPLATLAYAGQYASMYAGMSGGYGGGGGYGNGYGGYGGGNTVLDGLGRMEIYQQEAFLLREQNRAANVVSRRKTFDEYLYERDNSPTPEDDRQKLASIELERSRNNPPLTEILSGKSLNALLSDLSKLAPADSARLQKFPLPLGEDTLAHINVSQAAGNLALLKENRAIVWPLVLAAQELKPQRDQLADRGKQAVRQAEMNGRVDSTLIRLMGADVDELRAYLRKQAANLAPSMYIEASTFLNQFDDAIRALQQRDVVSHFNGAFALKAKTVAELVNHMTRLGLHFAPAVAGDETAYQALHTALAACDRSLVAKNPEPKKPPEPAGQPYATDRHKG
jgi:hypothetical protein